MDNNNDDGSNNDDDDDSDNISWSLTTDKAEEEVSVT